MPRDIVSKGWTKLDSGILDSTLWTKDHETLRVWIALLAKSDAGGYARVSVPMMAQICQLSIERFEEIIEDLSSPDQYSRSTEHEGRRVQSVEGGYVILNYERYRDMKTRAMSAAERKRRQRERERADQLIAESHGSHECHNVTPDEDEDEDEDEKQIQKKKDSAWDVPVPDDLLAVQGFTEKWAEWLEWRRKEKRVSVTVTAAKKQLADLAKNPATAIAAINQAIASDWQGLFPDKQRRAAKEPEAIDWSKEEGVRIQ